MPPFLNAITAPRPRTSKRQTLLPQPLLRAVAVACIFYLGLASCRALLPGLCANLPASAQVAEAVYGGKGELHAKRPCCCAGSAPYCAPDERNSGGPGAGVPQLADCAFCKITAVAGGAAGAGRTAFACLRRIFSIPAAQ